MRISPKKGLLLFQTVYPWMPTQAIVVAFDDLELTSKILV